VAGTVEGDVRVAGGQVTISGGVAEDVLATGGQVTITSSGQVGGDVIVSAGQLAIDGTVTGSVVGTAGSYSKSGQIGGADEVTISDTRDVVDRTPAAQALDAVRHFLAVMLVGGLMLWLTPRTYHSLRMELRTRPLRAAGLGILGLIGYFVIVIAVAVVMIVVAIPLGALGFGVLTAIEIIAGILAISLISLVLVAVCAYVVDVIVGSAIASFIPQDERSSRWQELGVLAAGTAVVVFVTSLPLVGPWFKFVVIVLGLGALLSLVVGWWRGRRGGSTITASTSAIPAPPP